MPAYTDAYTITERLAWNGHKRLKNLLVHEIDFADLEAFFDGDLLTREDEREAYGESRFQSIGLFEGEILFVVWALDDEESVPHLISARGAVKHEEQTWCQRYPRRP